MQKKDLQIKETLSTRSDWSTSSIEAVKATRIINELIEKHNKLVEEVERLSNQLYLIKVNNEEMLNNHILNRHSKLQ